MNVNIPFIKRHSLLTKLTCFPEPTDLFTEYRSVLFEKFMIIKNKAIAQKGQSTYRRV
jgi:hypothetical protein